MRVNTPTSSHETEQRVAQSRFALLDANARLGTPSTVVAVPVFGLALAQQGELPGFMPWAVITLLMPVVYHLFVSPRQERLAAAGRFDRLASLQVAFMAVFGGLWGLAAALYFAPEPARLAVLVVTVMALTMTVSFSTAIHLPSVYAFSLPLTLPFAVRAVLERNMLTSMAAAAVVLVLAVVLAYAHQFNRAMLKSIRMGFDNARLLAETRESLERQTAMAEILRVISRSPTDTQPVFDAIVAACQRLFDGRAIAFSVPRGGQIETVAFADDGTRGERQGGFLEPWPLDRDSAAGACILDARIINVADTEVAVQQFPRMQNLAIALGYRSGLFVPLISDRQAIGMIGILRATTGAFSERETTLAGAFADQAVIAIQNARLFQETQEALARHRHGRGAACDLRFADGRGTGARRGGRTRSPHLRRAVRGRGTARRQSPAQGRVLRRTRPAHR